MLILAIDTCTEPGSLALLTDDGELATECLPGGWHSASLHVKIRQLLERLHRTAPSISAYGVTVGPGAFTAVRAGITAVKGLAEASNRPVVPVSTLQVLAKAGCAAASCLPDVLLAPVLDARRGQVFSAVYQQQDHGLYPVLAESVCSMKSFLGRVKELPRARILFCGIGLDPYSAEIQEAGWDDFAQISVPPGLAGTLAAIAAQSLRDGLAVAADAVDANYVRVSDAELFWKEEC